MHISRIETCSKMAVAPPRFAVGYFVTTHTSDEVSAFVEAAHRYRFNIVMYCYYAATLHSLSSMLRIVAVAVSVLFGIIPL